MNIISTRVIETCIDGTSTIEKTLDHAIDRTFIHHCAALGNLEYFPEFSRPFFRITCPGKFVVKGIEGADTFEIFFLMPSQGPERDIESLVRKFGP